MTPQFKLFLKNIQVQLSWFILFLLLSYSLSCLLFAGLTGIPLLADRHDFLISNARKTHDVLTILETCWSFFPAALSFVESKENHVCFCSGLKALRETQQDTGTWRRKITGCFLKGRRYRWKDVHEKTRRLLATLLKGENWMNW